MPTLTEQQLAAIMPACPNPGLWSTALNRAMSRFHIDSPPRMAAFLAQVAHESGQLTRLTENLNYSAKRLMQVWPKRFPTLERAHAYEKNPQRLANLVYADRLGNGNEASGDGWRFRGRGLIQLTGRSNYRAAGRGIGLDLEQAPDILEQPEPAALSAAWFWESHGLNPLTDNRATDDDTEDFIAITRRINGGTVGLKERLALWKRAVQVLS